jgi:hypothetical protein
MLIFWFIWKERNRRIFDAVSSTAAKLPGRGELVGGVSTSVFLAHAPSAKLIEGF